MKLRPATLSDLPALVALESMFPTDRLSARQFRYHMDNPRAHILVCADAKAVLGYALVLRRGRTARLYSIAVAPAARGRGIGTRLLKAVIKKAKEAGCAKMGLEVRARSSKVIALYAQHGFVKSADLPRYYGDGADGLRMIKQF
jgi:ribosomal protein S18 acetylase RimI-like enzyme